MSNIPKRKNVRLADFDYQTAGAYFITICVKDRKPILGKIVGDDAHIVPINHLSRYGLICKEYIENINIVYDNIKVDKYAIMPNHIHMLISVEGTMKASSPTKGISSIVRSFKTMVTKRIGKSIWQRFFYDHVIRGQEDYAAVWEYIENNHLKWEEDELYKKDE